MNFGNLSDREKRTVRYAALGIGAYLVLFCGWKTMGFLNARRAEYRKQVQQAETLRAEIQPYDDKVLVVKKLMDGFHMDPAKLTKATVVAEASAAIQRAAMGGGVMVGAIRETTARASASELASLQLEVVGPVTAITGFLNRIEHVGYPLIVDSVQINAEPTRPGQVKVNLTIMVLDFEQWKAAEKSHA